jgi:hypothetical protein
MESKGAIVVPNKEKADHKTPHVIESLCVCEPQLFLARGLVVVQGAYVRDQGPERPKRALRQLASAQLAGILDTDH